MIIVSKYPGKCRVCGSRFTAGTKIEWIRGSQPAHVSCAVSKIVEVQDEGARAFTDVDSQYEADYGRSLASVEF